MSQSVVFLLCKAKALGHSAATAAAAACGYNRTESVELQPTVHTLTRLWFCKDMGL